MSLTPNQEEKLREQYLDLIRFYQEPVKGVVLAAERIDKKQRIPGSSIIEIRSAFEHVARAHAASNGFGGAEVADSGLECYDYCAKNLNKAHGHLFRAAYDAYDAIGIAMTEAIKSNVDGVSKTALFSVIPDAAEKIIAPYEEANRLITEEKKRKDVVSKEQEEKVYLQYEKAVKELIRVKKYVDSVMGALVEYDNEERARNRKTRNFTIIGLIIAALTLVAAILAIPWINSKLSTPAATAKEDAKALPVSSPR